VKRHFFVVFTPWNCFKNGTWRVFMKSVFGWQPPSSQNIHSHSLEGPAASFPKDNL
jgi:hypothetical protein